MTIGSGLVYHGTNTAVELGDRVKIRRFILSDQIGVVSYIPGMSVEIPKLHEDGRQHWAITLNDDSGIVTMLYAPDYLQPPKKIVFISRGDPVEIGEFI